MVMTHTHAKGQGQRSLGSKVIVETDKRTDRQTDGDDCIIYPVQMRIVTSFQQNKMSTRLISAVVTVITAGDHKTNKLNILG